MSRQLWCLFLLGAAACAEPDDSASDPDDPTGDEVSGGAFEAWEDPAVVAHVACADELVTVDPQAPIFFFYGAYRATGAPKPRVDAPPTLAIDTPGEKVILLRRPGVPCVGTVPELAPWIARGGLIAHVMSIEELQAALDHGDAADRIEAMLRAGYAYVAVDEIGRSSTAWRNGGARVTQLHDLLTTLASRDLDRRLIVYFNSYNMAGSFHLYSHTLALLRDHARIVGSEIYVHTSNVFSPGIEPAGHCSHSIACFEQLAAEMSAAAPGINVHATTVIATSDEYTQGSPAELCDAPGGGHGALYRQFAAIHAGAHTRLQRGIGGYTLGRIERSAHPSWGPATHVACMNRLEAWWSTHPIHL